MDIGTIGSLLSSLKTATDIVTFFRESTNSLEKAEYKLKLADLISAIADAKIEASAVQEQLQEKDDTIRQLRTELEIKAKVRYEAPYYWLDMDTGKDGPFCQCCYDGEKKLIHLQGYGNGQWNCKHCKNGYHDKSYREPTVHEYVPNY